MSTENTITQTRGDQGAVQPRVLDFVAPVVDLHRDAQGYRLDVELPGVPKNGVGLTVEDGKLIITGHRHASKVQGRMLHRERDQRDFRRVFDLDPSIDVEKIEASMDRGLLQVHLRKAEVHLPRKIQVG